MTDTLPPVPTPAEASGTGGTEPVAAHAVVLAVIGAVGAILMAYDVGTNEQRAAIAGVLTALLTAAELLWVRSRAWSARSVREVVNAVRAGAA